QVLCLLADEDPDAEALEPLHIGAVGEIAALHRVAEIVHDLGNAAHADAADADEVNVADVERSRTHQIPPAAKLSCAGPPPFAASFGAGLRSARYSPRPSASTRSASERTALG